IRISALPTSAKTAKFIMSAAQIGARKSNSDVRLSSERRGLRDNPASQGRADGPPHLSTPRDKKMANIKVVKLGWFQNGSFCSRGGDGGDVLVCYWLVDCPAMREANNSKSSSARDINPATGISTGYHPWIYSSRKEAKAAAKREAQKPGSGARYS